MTPEQREHLHARWAGRTRSEWASSQVMARLADEVQSATGDASLGDDLRRAADDEAHHGDLCVAVVQQLGPVPERSGTLPGLPPARSADPAVALVERVLFLLVTGEAIASALLGQLAQTCRDDLQPTIFRIAVDESRHAQLGWRVLDTLVGRLSPAQRAELVTHVPAVVGMGVASFRSQLTTPWPELAQQWGLADQGMTEAVARKVIATYVGPELGQRGLWQR